MNLRSAFSRLFVLWALLLGGTAPGWTHSFAVTHWGSAFYGAPYAAALEKGFFLDA